MTTRHDINIGIAGIYTAPLRAFTIPAGTCAQCRATMVRRKNSRTGHVGRYVMETCLEWRVSI